MKQLKNESGAALGLVLLTIIVMGVLFTALGFQLTSTNQQVNKSQQYVQAENLAIMGQEYFEASVKKLNRETNDQPLKENIQEHWNNERTIVMDDAVSHTEYTVRILDSKSDANNISYESVGVSGDVEEVIQGTLTINTSGSPVERVACEKNNIHIENRVVNYYTFLEHLNFDSFDRSEDAGLRSSYQGDTLFSSGIAKTTNNVNTTISGNAVFEHGLQVKNGEELEVFGDLIVRDGGLHLNNKAKLIIHGNLYIQEQKANKIQGTDLMVYNNHELRCIES
ncbi:hypothetical protein [Halobacillus seohaensis]|uniref:Type 4 fimbrial biogenesis protein PilX N-terminal domain-containing protein n=1 Tax=Halobacillus seohaensis TaxID=447421 RepID=A0ABW2EM84_9BACI